MDAYQYVVSRLGGPYEKCAAMPIQLSHGLAGVPIGAALGAGAGWLSERDNPDAAQRHKAMRNGAIAGAALGGLGGAVVGDYRYTNALKAQEAAAEAESLAKWSRPETMERARRKLQAEEPDAPSDYMVRREAEAAAARAKYEAHVQRRDKDLHYSLSPEAEAIDRAHLGDELYDQLVRPGKDLVRAEREVSWERHRARALKDPQHALTPSFHDMSRTMYGPEYRNHPEVRSLLARAQPAQGGAAPPNVSAHPQRMPFEALVERLGIQPEQMGYARHVWDQGIISHSPDAMSLAIGTGHAPDAIERGLAGARSMAESRKDPKWAALVRHFEHFQANPYRP